ncbi:hypothetical protein BT96DRAFT_977738 [Gymnopus androsaceus JB14]|uniref:Uncharacterized protein n=1 Tax=Gymnopus androsaceus JB14 TaxID=1447944 RepID=A0A6A4HE98_9AGAR|nr:hypothetical protein BT96DRAFT_977738 [Gymnopus androsaceus JB14]
MFNCTMPLTPEKTTMLSAEPCEILKMICEQTTEHEAHISSPEIARLIWKHFEASKIDPNTHVPCWLAFHTLAHTMRSKIKITLSNKEKEGLFDVVIALAQEARRLCTPDAVSLNNHTQVLLDLATWLRSKFQATMDARDIEECRMIANIALQLQSSNKSMLRCEALRLIARSIRSEFITFMGAEDVIQQDAAFRGLLVEAEA